MAKSTKILVATRELTGGAKKDAPVTVKSGDELTPDKAKELGLSGKDIDALKLRGDIVEVEARVADTGSKGDNAALKAAEERAEKAEAEVATLTEQVEALTAERDALQTAAAKTQQGGN